VLLLYACAHKISLKYLFLQKKLPSKYVVKYASSVTHFVWQIYFPNEFQIKNIKYIHRNLRYYETKVQLLYLSGNHLPLVMIYKNKMVTLKNWILKYIDMKNINIHFWIEKEVSCSNKCNVFISDIEICAFENPLNSKLLGNTDCFYWNCMMYVSWKTFHWWTCLHRYDLHIIIRWPENIRICLHCGNFWRP
jgi:hypothetical protein